MIDVWTSSFYALSRKIARETGEAVQSPQMGRSAHPDREGSHSRTKSIDLLTHVEERAGP